MTDEELLTVYDAAERLKVHPRTIRRWIKAGKLRAHTIPGRGSHGIEYRIDKTALRALLNQVEAVESANH